MYDIVEKEYTTAYIFECDDSGQEKLAELIFSQMQELNYDSHNCFTLLKTVGILITVHFILVILYLFVLKPINYLVPKNSYLIKAMKMLKNRLFFQDILSVHIETYLEMLIGIWLNLRHPLKSKLGEVFSYYFTIYISCWALLILPVLLVWVACSIN